MPTSETELVQGQAELHESFLKRGNHDQIILCEKHIFENLNKEKNE